MTYEGADDLGNGSWTPADVAAIVANPFNAIHIDPSLTVPHETVVDEETWVGANARLIQQLGATAYLRNLLVILKGGVPSDTEDLEMLSALLDEFFLDDDYDDEAEEQDEAEDGDEDDEDDDADWEWEVEAEVAAAEGKDEADRDRERIHAAIDADVLDGYVSDLVLGRLESEPGLVARAIAAVDAHGLPNDYLAGELEDLESDPDVLRDVLRASRETWDSLDPDASRLLVIYLIDRVVIGPSGQPVEQQVTIDWRVPLHA